MWVQMPNCSASTGGTVSGSSGLVGYTDRGRSQAEFLGHKPTGKSYEVVAMEWFVFKDGLIHRRWGARDSAAQSTQMGVTD